MEPRTDLSDIIEDAARQRENAKELIERKIRFLTQLESDRGIVSVACQNFGISRQTYYEWIKDPEFKTLVDEINETVIDFVEGKLFQKINGIQIGKINSEGELIVYDVPPSDIAITFYLKTRGKRRGYVEKHEIDHSNKGEKFDQIPTINVFVNGIPKSEMNEEA